VRWGIPKGHRAGGTPVIIPMTQAVGEYAISPNGSTMIDKLTDEQKALLPVWRDKWIAIGLSCEPLDLPNAKECGKCPRRF